jgi:hypothetical protein
MLQCAVYIERVHPASAPTSVRPIVHDTMVTISAEVQVSGAKVLVLSCTSLLATGLPAAQTHDIARTPTT